MKFNGQFSIFAALAVVAVSAHAAIASIARSIGDFFDRAWAYFAPEPMSLAIGGYPAFTISGRPLDRALQQSLRHEAGFSRRAADRHT